MHTTESEKTHGGTTEETSEETVLRELSRRVVFSMLIPTTRISELQDVKLKELTQLLRLAYFRQLRSGGSTLKEAAEILDVSMRTAKRLSQQVKENFFAPELSHELPRRIEFMLWAQPMSIARLQQVLSDCEPQEVERALLQLEQEGRVCVSQKRDDLYEVARPVSRIVRPSMISRVGALNSFMNNITNAVFGRFFTHDDASFVRTLSFRIHPSDLQSLRDFYEDSLLTKLRELEENVDAHHGEDDTVQLQLSVCWAPYEQPTTTPTTTTDMSSSSGETR